MQRQSWESFKCLKGVVQRILLHSPRLAQRRRNQPLRGRPPNNKKVDPVAATDGGETTQTFATPSVDSILSRKRMAAWAERVIHQWKGVHSINSPLTIPFSGILVEGSLEETKNYRVISCCHPPHPSLELCVHVFLLPPLFSCQKNL